MDSSIPEGDAPAADVPGAELIGVLEAGRRQFLALVEHIRPELHRYCTRMTGSTADGEDVVQETLARAYYELSELAALPALRPWLFRIAHNRAIDHWRRESHRASEPLDAALEIAGDDAHEPDQVLARHQAVRAAVSCFMELAPAQRGCVILKDVLDHSIDEIGVELGLSVPAVKAALHRGREALARITTNAPRSAVAPEISPALRRYSALFNAHDWDGVRALLAKDVRLDLVSRRKSAGRRDVGSYFANYQRTPDWRVEPAWLDGREVLAVFADPQIAAPTYFIELAWTGERLTLIRDFRYVPYIVDEARIEIAD
jgi:RNA polymerase sigma-70 factor (ECF subfamily)